MKHRLACVAVILALGMAAAAQTLSLQFDGGVFKVVGLPASALRAPAAGWQSVFVVYAGTGDVPPLAGSYSVETGALVFRPKYPLAAGPRYRAVFRGAGAPIEKTFDGPARTVTPSARVERVYPSADVLPSNQLRLYIYFSAPMSRGEAPHRIHVLDADGKPLRDVFLPGQEVRLSAGETFRAPHGVPHTYRVESAFARWLVFSAPARFDGFVRAVERRLQPEAGFDAVLAHERKISPELGGRTVFDDRPKKTPRQLPLFG